MDLLNHLEVYITAQKDVGFNAFVFSAGMITSALILHFYGSSQLAMGIRNGNFIIGILLVLMGVGLRFSQEKILLEKKVLYQTDQIEFKQAEIERMTKVKNNYPIGQAVMTGLVLIALLAFLMIKNQVWQGVSLSLSIFFLGNVIIEAFSYLAILAYYNQLTH